MRTINDRLSLHHHQICSLRISTDYIVKTVYNNTIMLSLSIELTDSILTEEQYAQLWMKLNDFVGWNWKPTLLHEAPIQQSCTIEYARLFGWLSLTLFFNWTYFTSYAFRSVKCVCVLVSNIAINLMKWYVYKEVVYFNLMS